METNSHIDAVYEDNIIDQNYKHSKKTINL